MYFIQHKRNLKKTHVSVGAWMNVGDHVKVCSVQVNILNVDVFSDVNDLFQGGHPVIAHQNDVYVCQVILSNLFHEIAENAVYSFDLNVGRIFQIKESSSKMS